MAQQKTNFITHTFGGGWATDFGPTFYGAPDQGLQFKIPYLTNAKNLVYEFDGGPPQGPWHHAPEREQPWGSHQSPFEACQHVPR